MRSKERARQLGEMVALGEAIARGAETDLRRADGEHDEALATRDTARGHRDAAQAYWGELVAANRPQPELVRLGANWLLHQERRLAEDEQALADAANQLERARDDYVLALARDSATRRIRSDFARTAGVQAERRQTDNQADELLWRRGR